MFNNVIKISFAAVGALTGFTLTNTFIVVQSIKIPSSMEIPVFMFASLAAAIIFYSAGSRIIEAMVKVLDKVEEFIHGMTLYELTLSAVGLIVGLIIANLITIPINKIDIIGMPLSVIANILFGCIGVAIAVGKRHETLFEAIKSRSTGQEPKVLDTSVIIDGRIVDIIRSGFLEGELIVPSFILEELRHIADSTDSLKRNRGRRGLDVLNSIQKELNYPVRVESFSLGEGAEADSELLKVAKRLGGKVLTIDYNLNKVASFQGVPVMNINELANAVKPVALPGEEMNVQVIKDGKENGQGIGYLEDGTMIVVEGGRRHIGECLLVVVTSVLQTAAGRMIFAKPKYTIERAI